MRKIIIIDRLRNVLTINHNLHKLLINYKHQASMTYINHGFTKFVHLLKRFCVKKAIFHIFFQDYKTLKNSKKQLNWKCANNCLRLVCWHLLVLLKHSKHYTFSVLSCFRRANSDTGICPFKDKANFKCVGWNNSKQVESKPSSPNTYKVNSIQT